jgi:hypothetical protein
MGSMDISIAQQSAVGSQQSAVGSQQSAFALCPLPFALTRSHERQPRFRQLELGGVERSGLEAVAHSRRELSPFESLSAW